MTNRPDELYGATTATVAEPTSMLLPGHDVPLGRYTTVRRLLPQRARRTVGAWCFVDQFGPDDVAGRLGMQVPPHPHTGLQTVTWLVQGEILHRDSLGSLQSIHPGQLNLMTAGRGIAHSEESPTEHPPMMHGLQLWVALPEGARHLPPRFDHYAEVPVLDDAPARITVVVGELAGVRSPALVHSPIVGADVALAGHAATRLPLEPEFEHAVLVQSGAADVAGVALDPGTLLYLGPGRSHVSVRATGVGRPAGMPDPASTGVAPTARLFLLGGVPFDEPLVMWWNFVGRSHEDIVAAREDWMSGRTGTVRGFAGDPLPAPPMPTTRLRARDRHGTTSG